MPDTRLKLTLAYDGSGFRGWAAQPGLRTVEATMREALDTIFPSSGSLAVAGRTDTGVHALANVASVDVSGGPAVERAAEALNSALPEAEFSCAVLGTFPQLSLPGVAQSHSVAVRGASQLVASAAARRRAAERAGGVSRRPARLSRVHAH